MIYVSCFAVSVFFAYLAQRSRNKGVILFCSVVSVLVPSILGGLRAYGVGTDTVVYAYSHFRGAMRSSSFLSFLERQFGSKYAFNEIGYKALCYITANTLQHENWCYFVYQLVTVGCVYVGAYRHKDKIPLALTMFIFFMMRYNYSYNIIRQSMAAAIIFMGLYDMEKGRYGVFLVYVLVASLFHTSALSAIPLILAFHMFNSSDFFSRKIFLRMFVVGGALAFLIMARPIMRNIVNTFTALSKYDYYFDSKYDDSGASFGLVIILVGELIMSLFYPEGATKSLNVNFRVLGGGGVM